MKFKTAYLPLIAIVIIGLMTSFANPTSKEGDYDWMKQRLMATKAFTIEVINAMPEDKFDFKPDDGIRSFQEQAYHLVYSIDYYNRLFASGGNAAWSPEAEDSKSKAEIMKWANDLFDSMEKTILAASNNQQLTSGIMGYLDHNAHHRGQMVIYLRMNGVAAPSYR